MGFEPQKFFIGLMDFFAILLPGGFVTYLVKDAVGPALLGNDYLRLSGAEGWIAFLFSAYLLGHLIFLVGSFVLDDILYDRIRNATPAQQRRLADDHARNSGRVPYSPASRFTRWIAGWAFDATNDTALMAAVRIKQHYLTPLNANDAVNAFQWAKLRLIADRSEALSLVQRFEADSKFFRSLCIALAYIILWSLATGRYIVAAAAAVFLPLSLWRYKDQRIKATSQAYWYVITAEAARQDGFRARSVTHAGGVVFQRHDPPRYLVVKARDHATRWVLPKGHIEPGESAASAAVREVREEAGVLAKIVAPIGRVAFSVEGEHVSVQFYLLEAYADGLPTSERRELQWLPLEEAVSEAFHDETKTLLARGAMLTSSA